ncbi:unnamed protein product [Arabis nemorensis]|uniref:Uncharacterized protein n=1 Tax=Arabis nemorensis TaxID=586526 RepID=A0A565BCM7_9BRAS|nr:unnamed protein product [Arabis nemorensis]
MNHLLSLINAWSRNSVEYTHGLEMIMEMGVEVVGILGGNGGGGGGNLPSNGVVNGNLPSNGALNGDLPSNGVIMAILLRKFMINTSLRMMMMKIVETEFRTEYLYVNSEKKL